MADVEAGQAAAAHAPHAKAKAKAKAKARSERHDDVLARIRAQRLLLKQQMKGLRTDLKKATKPDTLGAMVAAPTFTQQVLAKSQHRTSTLNLDRKADGAPL